MTIYPKDQQYVVHDYLLSNNDVHIIYLRKLDGYNLGSNSDELDYQIKISIESSYPDANESVNVITTYDDLKKWDDCLLNYKQLTANYRYSFGHPFCYLIGVICYATILVPKDMQLDSFINIGDYRYLDYQGADKVFNAIYYNPLMLLQQHPYIHGINCYREEYDFDCVYFLYHHSKESEQVWSIVDVKAGSVKEILYGDNAQDLDRIKAEIYEFNHSKHPRFVKLNMNREKDLFFSAKQILKAVLNAESNPSSMDVLRYLENLEEA